jgi:site-specific DNA-methyltransferase (adenine-specific)/adenine-specific DNA-methyltransferase
MGRKMLPPRGGHWKYKQSRIDEMEKEGRIRINEKGSFIDLEGNRVRGVPEFLQTEDTPVDSQWTDLKGYVLSSRYPTENPEELLDRVVRTSSNEGDLVIDAFAGSGTTCAVAETLRRRWIGIDCGKLAIYTMQKRLLNLKTKTGKTTAKLECKPFTLYNAGLYDFSKLRELPWDSWRFFALQLFQCRDEVHKIGGVQLDGYLKGSSVLVFNHLKNPGARFSEETLRDLHEAFGSRIGSRLFVIAPALTFDFQQDYIDMDGVRYYALRIPYSIINELHQREFTALKQPSDEMAVNETVEAVGFDFIRTPELKFVCGSRKGTGRLFEEGFIKIGKFKSEALVREPLRKKGNLETLSMVMLDYDFDHKSQVFDLDAVFYAGELQSDNWEVRFPLSDLGDCLMAVFIDLYGNEARVVIDRKEFGAESRSNSKKTTKR